ncbi:phosphoglycerate mutase-like protein [Pseudovirgaria hyperparasitica]|uniref:3-phytase n=1 Tax=Pseudovirgaria hyperparasitica TaxID=470096 RepID=A0A6A6W4L8_9PEZI|nr:phosphoglycerate mutase-like protein [Pseudovirgaria hyperparasitica]KAF2756906.1 phosphoglycerate mutase-like protein [Pseudovirgaria hyperparasitica]
MTTLQPRQPYSTEELKHLYPQDLQLQLVQVLLRHGERTPVSPRFQHTGLPVYWPYCRAAKQLTSTVMATTDWKDFDLLKYRRRLETFGTDDSPIVAVGPKGELDAVCQPGELTDKGRETTLALGKRLRSLYVDQLNFMPKLIADSDMIYLRATPIPRALESVQQAFWGMYPPSARTADFPPPTILTRTPSEETLFPNEGSCRRFAQLSRAFAQRTAERWNDSDDMAYLNKVIGKHMPAASPRVAVDSHPRLSGIMDTLNATLAHGSDTRLPSEFYDPKARAIIDKIAVEEWYSGYKESAEYRTVGIGALAGDIVARMVGSVETVAATQGTDVIKNVRDATTDPGNEKQIKLALSGCHDTTLAALLTSLGAFDGESWPPFTSHVAIELFRKNTPTTPTPTSLTASSSPPSKPNWWTTLFGPSPSTTPRINRTPTSTLSTTQKSALDGFFVRVRYNDKVMQVPACAQPGKHFEDDTTLCTLAAFKGVVDAFTPRSWKGACRQNLDKAVFPEAEERAGF